MQISAPMSGSARMEATVERRAYNSGQDRARARCAPTERTAVPGRSTRDSAAQRDQRTDPQSLATLNSGSLVSRLEFWTAATSRILRSPIAAAVELGLCGVALEVALWRGWLAAFSLAGHPGFPPLSQDPIVWLLDDGDTGMVRFLILLAAAFVPY